MRATYRFLAFAVPVIVALQAAFIAMGIFGLGKWVEDGNDFTKSVLESSDSNVTGGVGLGLHGIGAIVLVVVALALLIVSFFAKVPGGVRWAVFIFVDTLLQWVFAFAAFGVWAVGALHGLNAFVLAGLGFMAAKAAGGAPAVEGSSTASRPA